MMVWEQLLSPVRLGAKPRPGHASSAANAAYRSPFQRDYDRIVFSSAFRRLQDKTQVFPLAESDYVRTRLTHSLEAACVGRSLGSSIGSEIVARHKLPNVHPSDIGAIVAAACLAHDIGNPPFGHSGEDAIQHWFRTSPVAARVGTELTDVQRSDIARFEGNAQGFRIVTRLQMPDNPGGLQLTCATLGAFAKYPVDSLLPEGERKRASTKKFSFFDSERELFAEVAAQTGLLCRGGYGVGESLWCRHPLAFIVEAADDICYRLVDFEDGMRVGLLSYEEVSEAFLAIIGEDKYRARAAAMRYPKERIEFLRALAIGKVIEQSASVFLDNEEAILSGRFETPLIDQTTAHEVLERIVKRSRETIYINARGLEIEAAGFEVVGGLLDIFVEAVEDAAASAKAGRKVNPRSRTLLQLVPEQVIGENKTPAEDVYTRLQRMADFVSGMTDSYAVSLYKKLRGISLPGQ